MKISIRGEIGQLLDRSLHMGGQPVPNRLVRWGRKAIMTAGLGVLVAGCGQETTASSPDIDATIKAPVQQVALQSTNTGIQGLRVVTNPTFLPSLSYFTVTQNVDISDPGCPTLWAHQNGSWTTETASDPTTMDPTVRLPLADSLIPGDALITHKASSPSGASSCTVAAGAYAMTSPSNYNMSISLLPGSGLTQSNGGELDGPSQAVITVNAEWLLGTQDMPVGSIENFQFVLGGVTAPNGYTRVIINLVCNDISTTNGVTTTTQVGTIALPFNQKFPPSTFPCLWSPNVFIKNAVLAGHTFQIVGTITFKVVGG